MISHDFPRLYPILKIEDNELASIRHCQKFLSSIWASWCNIWYFVWALYWRKLRNSSGLTESSTIMWTRSSSRPSLQNSTVDNCNALRMEHVSVLVKEWTWIPDTLNNLYSCECGLTCLWTNSDALEKKPDAHFYETNSPPYGRVSAASSHSEF